MGPWGCIKHLGAYSYPHTITYFIFMRYKSIDCRKRCGRKSYDRQWCYYKLCSYIQHSMA